MRPRYLEIEGLQSFKDKQVIDFDHLSETGLFGIFGPTGSGKSTVLDAITLALYGKVHRANGTQGVVNTGLNSVKVSFTFDILKANERKTYRVERVYKRKKGSDTSCELKVARLLEVNEAGVVPIVDKHGEVSTKVEELIGLRHDDFTRAVVLPQNKFQEFLLMRNSDKSKMLERIFYLEEYGILLNRKLSKKLAITNNMLSNVQGALSQMGDASDKALEEAAAALKAAEEKRAVVLHELKAMENGFNEAKEVWGLVCEAEAVHEKESKHLASLDQINEKKILLDKAIKADGIIDLIKKFNTTKKAYADTLTQLESLSSGMPILQKQLSDTRSEYDNLIKQAEIERPKLVEQKTKLKTALEIKSEITKLEAEIAAFRLSYKNVKDKITAAEQKIDKETADIAAFEENLKAQKTRINELKVDTDYRNEIQKGVRLEDELNAARKNEAVQSDNLKAAAADVVRLQNKLQTVSGQVLALKNSMEGMAQSLSQHENLKPGSREDLESAFELYHEYKSLINILKEKNRDVEILRRKHTISEEEVKNLETSLKKEMDIYNRLEAERKSASDTIEILKKSIEKNTAYILAAGLKEGSPCPVCGSSHHPCPAADNTDEELTALGHKLEEANARLQEAEYAFREAEKKYIALKEQHKSANAQKDKLWEEFEGKKNEYEGLMLKLPEGWRKLDIRQLELELEKLNSQNSEKKKAFDTWETKLEEIKKQIGKGNEQYSSQLAEEKGIQSELQAKTENHARAEALLKEASQNSREIEQRYKEFLKGFGIQAASAESKRILDNDRKVEKLQQEMDNMQKNLEETRKSTELLKKERESLTASLKEIETDGKHMRAQKEEKEKKIGELSAQCSDIEGEIKNIDEKLEAFSKREKELSEASKAYETRWSTMVTQKATLEKQREIYSNNLKDDEDRITIALEEKGFLNTEDVEASIIEKEQQKKLGKDIEDFEQGLRNIQAQKTIIQKKLDNRSITEEKWLEISRGYEEKVKEKEECTSRYDVAKNIYTTKKERHEKWKTLNKEFDSLNRKLDMLEQIKVLLRGNSFIEYIAEERLRYIAKVASDQLGVMTKYKYSLELDSENGFVICDNSNGGVRRMVSSLSGGETFMAALSLALALSKQIQLKGQSPLEFFFLDEGFGTLDNNLLDTVIDSLERLSTKERVIGLISHVPELRNRITRRLIIDPPSVDGKGSLIRIEKA